MPRAALSRLRARWWSGCMPIWRAARSRSRIRSKRWRISAFTLSPCGRGCVASLDARRVRGGVPYPSSGTDFAYPMRSIGVPRTTAAATYGHLLPQGEKEEKISPRAKLFRCPGVQAARHRLLVAAALWRDVKSDNAGIADQCRKIPRLEEKFLLGVYGIVR